jgi:hypothetical protein
MIEREMQELIWAHPERFFNEPLKQIAWEASSSEVGRADLVFEDRHGRLLIIEVKRGKLPRGAIDQLHDYFGMMKQKYPAKAVEMMVVAWVIPQERRLACEHYDIECREFSERFFREIAKECGYLFASESQMPEKKPEGSVFSDTAKLTASSLTESVDKAGTKEENVIHDQADESDRPGQNTSREAAVSLKALASEKTAQNIRSGSQTLLLPGLPMALAVLELLADDLEHSSQEIQERLRAEFGIVPQDLIQKHKNGMTVFHNNVLLALANLQGAPHKGPKAIDKVGKRVYRIKEYGKALLKRNPLDLTIKDL